MRRTTILLILMLAARVSGQTNAVTIEQHMRQVIIPSIEFRQANPIDVLTFLIEASIASDPESRPTPCIGTIITNTPPAASSFTYQLEDGSTIHLPPLTLEYRRISLLDALDRVTAQVGLTYKFEDNQLILLTKDGKKIVRKESVEPAGGAYVAPAAGATSAHP